MAIVLGSKNIKDTNEYKDYAIGLSLPITINNIAFEQTFQTNEQVKSNIKNLLLTRKGERILQPEFGSGLHEVLFEFNNDEYSSIIESEIESAINQWLPFVTIQDIEIEQTDFLKDTNRVNVSITFRIGENVGLENVTFTV